MVMVSEIPPDVESQIVPESKSTDTSQGIWAAIVKAKPSPRTKRLIFKGGGETIFNDENVALKGDLFT